MRQVSKIDLLYFARLLDMPASEREQSNALVDRIAGRIKELMADRVRLRNALGDARQREAILDEIANPDAHL